MDSMTDTGSRLHAAELADEIEFLAARARSIGTAHANALLAPLDLRVRSYAVLALACSDLAPSQRELADFLNLDASQVVALVDELERRGLISREPDARDRRTNAIMATTAGRALHERAATATRAAEDQALAALSPAERVELRELLRRVAFAPAPSIDSSAH
jgi:DNA-binding MarR family transcriptional regulator